MPFFTAAWPNGKALLSGGKDCGFESHRCRRVDVCILFLIEVGMGMEILRGAGDPAWVMWDGGADKMRLGTSQKLERGGL